MSYSKLKISSQEKSLSVYFSSSKSYFSFDSQTACIHNEATPTACVVQNSNKLGKPGSDMVIYVLRRRWERCEDLTVSFSLRHSDPIYKVDYQVRKVVFPLF